MLAFTGHMFTLFLMFLISGSACDDQCVCLLFSTVELVGHHVLIMM